MGGSGIYMTLAFSSKSPWVPNPRQDHNASRWIASLSDGSTVFEDVMPQSKSAWLRLRDYVELHTLKVTNLRLEAYGRVVNLIPYRDAEGNPQLNGYWHSKKIGQFLNASNLDVEWRGIGYLKGREIFITWVDHLGNVSQEIRPYSKDNPALIINNAV
jgi:hypothetical protein